MKVEKNKAILHCLYKGSYF